MMEMLVIAIVVILLQYISISNHHLYLKFTQYLCQFCINKAGKIKIKKMQRKNKHKSSQPNENMCTSHGTKGNIINSNKNNFILN